MKMTFIYFFPALINSAGFILAKSEKCFVLTDYGSSSPNFKGDLKISDQNNWGDLSKKLNLGGELNLRGTSNFRGAYKTPMMPWLLC